MSNKLPKNTEADVLDTVAMSLPDAVVERILAQFPGPVILPGPRSSLTLDADGFQERVFPLHVRSSWREVNNFKAFPIFSPFSGSKESDVVYYHDRRRESWWFSWIWKQAYNAGINPVDGLSIEQLANLLTQWREAALARAREQQQA